MVVGARQNWESVEPVKRQVQLAQDMDITLNPSTPYGMSYNTDALKAVWQ